MLNKKGQALVEFVLILPVIVFLIFSIIDFGRIINTKSYLENKTNDVLKYLEEGKNYDETITFIHKDDSQVNLNLIYNADYYLTVRLVKDVTIITPGLNLVLGKTYQVTTERIIPYE